LGGEEMLSLIIELIAGALGGNAAGALLKKQSLGTLWNSVLGIIGGGLTGQLLGGASAVGAMGILESVLEGGIGGGVLMAIIGLVKNAMAKKK